MVKEEQFKTLDIPPKARELILYQRTELLPSRKLNLLQRVAEKFGLDKKSYKRFVRSYADNFGTKIDQDYSLLMASKAGEFAKFLEGRAIKTVLDIGPGVSGLHAYLSDYIGNPNIYLLDKSETEDEIWYLFEDNGAFYNSLEISKELLERNGLEPDNIRTIEAPDDGQIVLDTPNIDLIMSTISWGFHYPISFYLDSVVELLSPDGALVVDVRKQTGGAEALEAVFKVKTVAESQKFLTCLCEHKD